MTPPDRRRQILDAALACFLERGYAATSIADIRTRSGATTGSIYHFFATKGAIAATLLREAVGGWSGYSAQAWSPDLPPETAIKASVGGLVRWAFAEPAQFRLMNELRSLALADPDFTAVRDLLDGGRTAGAAAYARMAAAGAVRNLPFDLAHALMLGPAYAYLARHRGGSDAAEGERMATFFADAAWRAVKA